MKGVTGFGFDLVRGTNTIEHIKSSFPSGKYLFAGIVDGRNIWANDLGESLTILQALEPVVGKGNYFVLKFFNCENGSGNFMGDDQNCN